MNPVEMIQQAIARVPLNPASVARADASITRSIGNEVERAKRIVETFSAWAATGPATSKELLAAARATSKWEGLSFEAEACITAAILASDSYEAAAELILDATPGAREGVGR